MANQADATAESIVTADTKAPPPRESGRFVKIVKVALATKAWSGQATILRKRASFPLLRTVIKNELTKEKISIPLDVIHEDYLAKSVIGHRGIAAASVLTLLYSLMLISRGLAITIKLGDVANESLLLGIPLAIIAGLRAASSWKLQREFAGELARRSNTPIKGQLRND